MKKQKVVTQASPDAVTLARLIGRREAFAAVAAKCSAAEAVQLRRIREEKVYLNHSRSWAEFCQYHLHMSRSNADRIIGLLDEFGPQYFVVSQLTRVSPETYRNLAPAIRNGALQVDGEAVALIPENASVIAGAIRSANTRRSIEKPGDREPAFHEVVAAIERRSEETARDFRALAHRFRSSVERGCIQAEIAKAKSALLSVALELDLA